MQRILNNPDNIVDEMLEGFLKAHSDIVDNRKFSCGKGEKYTGR